MTEAVVFDLDGAVFSSKPTRNAARQQGGDARGAHRDGVQGEPRRRGAGTGRNGTGKLEEASAYAPARRLDEVRAARDLKAR